MELTYKILWFENEPRWIKSKIDEISNIVENENFIFEVNTFKKEEDFTGNYNDYDFILVDLKLNDGTKGTKIIQDIRSGECYTDVLFYSQEGEEKLRQEIIKESLEGVFFCHREDFLEEFKKIFLKTLKKVQHPNNLRGLVMAETCDLDKLKKKILKEYFSLNHSKQLELEQKIHEKIEEFIKQNIDRINHYRKELFSINVEKSKERSEKAILEMIDESFFDFSKKARTIKNLIEFMGLDIDFDFEDYNSSIIEKRNKLAHEPEKITNGKIYFKDLCFTQDECRLIRKDIRRYKTLLEKILSIIESKKTKK